MLQTVTHLVHTRSHNQHLPRRPRSPCPDPELASGLRERDPTRPATAAAPRRRWPLRGGPATCARLPCETSCGRAWARRRGRRSVSGTTACSHASPTRCRPGEGMAPGPACSVPLSHTLTLTSLLLVPSCVVHSHASTRLAHMQNTCSRVIQASHRLTASAMVYMDTCVFALRICGRIVLPSRARSGVQRRRLQSEGSGAPGVPPMRGDTSMRMPNPTSPGSSPAGIRPPR